MAVGINAILDIDFPDIFNYEVDRNAPLPSVGPASKLIIDDDEGFTPQGNLVDEAHYMQLITKEVLTNDKKHLGHVDGFGNINITPVLLFVFCCSICRSSIIIGYER